MKRNGAIIKRARNIAEISMQELATLLGYGIDLVGRLERGDQRVQPGPTAKIARHFGLRYDWATESVLPPDGDENYEDFADVEPAVLARRVAMLDDAKLNAFHDTFASEMAARGRNGKDAGPIARIGPASGQAKDSPGRRAPRDAARINPDDRHRSRRPKD